MKIPLKSRLVVRVGLCLLFALRLCCQPLVAHAQVPYNQQLAFAGLRSNAGQGQFNAVQSDASGNLYLLLDQKDGVRVLKTDSTATNVLAQALLGAKSDIGLAMALDPAGNIYITGTTTSGVLAATAGAVFPVAADTSTNSFVAKFDTNLNPVFVTYGGSGRMAATGIAATANTVYITGSIFAATLPVTPAGILQSPASGSTQNGFVEKFNSTGTTLLYATYLTGYGGNTAPSAIAVDPAGDAYIAGTTSSSGYPTIAAVVPAILPATAGTSSGFLTKLTPNGDGITFSTFIPGDGITSLAYDPTAENLLLSGSIALGQFPIANVLAPLVGTSYQSLVRMPLDGSTVLTSTLLAPGTQSFITPTTTGAAWTGASLSTPSLPLPTLSTMGDSFGIRVTPQGNIDQAARFGGLATQNLAYASAPANITAITADATGQPIFVGSLNPTTSASLLSGQTFDASLHNAPTAALPSTVHEALLTPSTCGSGQCIGSAAYLTKLNTAAAPSLALSIDDAPNVVLRNLGSATATSLTLNATGFTLASNCPTSLAAGAECNIALTGSGPGTLTVQATGATTQIASIPATTASSLAIVFTPRELDFGIQTASSPAVTRVVTVSNLSQQSQTFTSALDAGAHAAASPFSEVSSDCTQSGPITTKLLAPGASCHITLGLTASTDGPVTANWAIGSRDVTLTGYTQANALTVSAAEVDFGTQFSGGLHLPRYLYLSNNSSTVVAHTAVSLPATSPFALTDTCPEQLEPHSVCQLALSYHSNNVPSSDAITIALDEGLTTLVTGQTLPQPGTNGTSVNPNLTVNPTTLNFPNAVVVTTTSSTAQTVTIGNNGSLAFALTLAITPDFTYTTNCPAALNGGGTCSVLIGFAPSQPGTRQGLLSVTAGAGTTPAYVNLSGVSTGIFNSGNGTLDFGSDIVGQPVVQWYKITQPFNQLSATTSGDYTAILVEDEGYGHGQPPASAFTTTTSGTCFNCWLGIQFKPSIIGPHTGTLTLVSSANGSPYAIALTGIGLPLQGLVLTSQTYDFGNVPVNSTSSPTLFTFTNLTSSTIPLTLSPPTVSGDFVVAPNTSGGASCTGTLPQNASCFIQVAFAPTATGQRNGALTLQTGSGSATASLSGFGIVDSGLALSPSELIFNNVPGALATQQTITLTNTGLNQLQIATPSNTLPDFQSSTNCTTLAPAATCTITVSFTPSTGPLTDTLTIPVTSAAGSATYTVPLTGNYTSENASLQIIPNQAEFGPTATGSLGLTQQFTINNLTAKSLVLNIALPRQFVLAGPPCSGLAPGTSCNFAVSFLPLTNADITGTLFAQATPTDGSGFTLNALGYVEGYGNGAGTLAVTGNLLPGDLYEPVLNFGQSVSGQTATQTLTLTNTASTVPLNIRRITSEWPFLATSTCGATLGYQQSCTVTLTYTPLNQVQTPTGGSPSSPPFNTDSGTLVIESDAQSSPNLVDLTGQALPVALNSPSNIAPLVSYTASQSSLTFAATQAGDQSLPQTIVLSNTGTAAVRIIGLQSSPDFSFTTDCATIVPGAGCSVSVSFTPQASGTRISALEISSDASSALDFISLIGAASPSTVVLNPSALDFGNVPLGTTATLPLQITNTAANAIVYNGATATGDYAVTGNCPASGSTLGANSGCSLQIAFTPTQAGTRTGTLSVSTTASTLPLAATLTGVGTQAQLQVTPSTLNFGSITIGAPANLTLTLSNTGNASIVGVDSTLALPSDYTVTTPCSTTTLVPGASCLVTITFTPTATGTRSGVLTVASINLVTSTTIPLSGIGIANGSFLLTVDGGATSSIAVASGKPATYNLTLIPQNGFNGTVVLTCNPTNAAQYANCSLLPSTMTLNGSNQNAVATINTITETSAIKSSSGLKTDRFGSAVLCLLTPTLFLFWRGRIPLDHPRATLSITLLTIAALTTLLAINGCGHNSTVNTALRFSPPGSYQYQVTATSTSGGQAIITQTVTLNLTVTQQ